MTHKDVLDLFFTRTYEKQLNDCILEDKEYVIPKDGILNYVCEIVDVPYSEYLSYIKSSYPQDDIKSYNITQSSSFEACEREIINAFLFYDDPGFTFVEIGKLFPQYVVAHNDVSFRKYGENQVKTACQLGLTYEYFNHWYLNCVSYIYNELPEDDQKSYLARAILRDPLYQKIMVDIQSKDVDILEYMYSIDSNETKKRRYDCVARLANICISEAKKHDIAICDLLDTKWKLTIKPSTTQNKTNTYEPLQMSLFSYEDFDDYAMVAEDTGINVGHYINAFSNLRCYKRNGISAPYKAMLLLSVMNLVERGIIASERIEPSAILKAEFERIKNSTDYDHELFNPKISNPFVHMANEGFWRLVPKISGEITAINQVEYAVMDKSLFACFLNDNARSQLRKVLLNTYFNNK